MNIREFYLENYPSDCKSDGLGMELNPEATFAGLWAAIRSNRFYEYIGVEDSIIRERIFERFAEITRHDYDYIYNEWLNNAEI
jgi:hypothetical protein